MTCLDTVAASNTARKPVILVVEDDVLVRFMTAEMLRDEGLAVVEAANASEALAVIGTGQAIDLVVTDVRMPGENDGIGLTEVLKAQQPQLPVVLVSTHLSPDVDHLADSFLAKPFRASELLELVARLIGPTWQNRLEIPRAS